MYNQGNRFSLSVENSLFDLVHISFIVLRNASLLFKRCTVNGNFYECPRTIKKLGLINMKMYKTILIPKKYIQYRTADAAMFL